MLWPLWQASDSLPCSTCGKHTLHCSDTLVVPHNITSSPAFPKDNFLIIHNNVNPALAFLLKTGNSSTLGLNRRRLILDTKSFLDRVVSVRIDANNIRSPVLRPNTPIIPKSGNLFLFSSPKYYYNCQMFPPVFLWLHTVSPEIIIKIIKVVGVNISSFFLFFNPFMLAVGNTVGGYFGVTWTG